MTSYIYKRSFSKKELKEGALICRDQSEMFRIEPHKYLWGIFLSSFTLQVCCSVTSCLHTGLSPEKSGTDHGAQIFDKGVVDSTGIIDVSLTGYNHPRASIRNYFSVSNYKLILIYHRFCYLSFFG